MPTSIAPLTLDEAKAAALGEWTSLSIELRPTEDRTGSGTVEPTRLTRHFVYQPDGTFTGVITMFGDDYGQVPMLEFEFRGHTVWGRPHPIAAGAFEIDYVLDLGFAVTPLLPDTAAMLNAALPAGMPPFEHGVKADILGKEFPMFNIVEGQTVVDYDLIWFSHDLLFMGAKHVDGTPFDRADRRPHQLQIPLARVA